MTDSHAKRASSIDAARAAVPSLLDALSGFAPRALPISEREYLERVLDFTAWDGKNVEQLAVLERPILFGGTLADKKLHPVTLAANVAQPLRGEVAPERALFLRDMFRRHLADRVAGIHRWNFGEHIYRNMLVLPAHIPDRKSSGAASRRAKASARGREPRRRHSRQGYAARGRPLKLSALAVYLPRNLLTGVEFALALLFDEGRGYHKFLKPCALETCGGYFLRSDKDGRPAEYHNACRQKLRAKSRHKRRKLKEP